MEPASAAHFIQQRYEQFYSTFNDLTAQAKTRFKQCQWVEQREAMRSRILLHDQAIEQIAQELSTQTKLAESNVVWWRTTGEIFNRATAQNAIAQTFFD
ncbi:MAG: isocitrate dehydrogenase kinase/phosphatase AceK regulatory subunit [Cytophagales bacterium]